MIPSVQANEGGIASKGKLSSAILSRRDLSQIPAIDIINTSVETLHLMD